MYEKENARSKAYVIIIKPSVRFTLQILYPWESHNLRLTTHMLPLTAHKILLIARMIPLITHYSCPSSLYPTHFPVSCLVYVMAFPLLCVKMSLYLVTLYSFFGSTCMRSPHQQRTTDNVCTQQYFSSASIQC